MKYLIEPKGWPCPLGDCPPGPFLLNGELCFKADTWMVNDHTDAYNPRGRSLFTDEAQATVVQLLVQPVVMVFSEVS